MAKIKMHHDNKSTSLIRGIRRWEAVAVVINSIIGAGIFGLPSQVTALLGPYSLFAFIVCAIFVTLVILCFAEVSSRFSETGGPYLYAREAFGSITGFEVGWLMWLARLTAFAANCNLLIAYLSYFWPAAVTTGPRAILITAIVVALTTVNVTGIRDVTMVSNIFTVGKMIPIIIFIAVGLWFLAPENFSPAKQPDFLSFSQAVLLLVYAFTGFEIALIPAGEAREPQRSLPFAILAGIGVVSLVYILIQVVCLGTLPELAGSERPLADAAGNFMGTAGAAVITAGVIISIIGNLTVVLLAGSRLLFAMASRNELPQFLATVHERFRTPHLAICLTAAVMFVITLSGSFIYAVTISTLARLVAYGATCLALFVLRRRNPQGSLFRAPLIAPFASLALIIWLLSNSTLLEAWHTIIAIIAAVTGLIIYALYRVLSRQPLKTRINEEKI
jgi:APA family basic amino acid/polyamine antiporter